LNRWRHAGTGVATILLVLVVLLPALFIVQMSFKTGL
jgi:hypothetical protein